MQKILIQLDTDTLPSSFDRVVAIDSGVDQIFSYGAITADNVEGLVHGGMFTRKPAELKNTAIFVGGGSVSAGEKVLKKVLETFIGPICISVMMDSNGSNTTAAAAVLAAEKHLSLSSTQALVLGGTGPVGCRTAQILAAQGATVYLASRSFEKAKEIRAALSKKIDVSRLIPCGAIDYQKEAANFQLVVSAGAAGVQLMSPEERANFRSAKVMIDLNAVPPYGLPGIEATFKGTDVNGVICYGALGVGSTKMKIHQAAVRALYESNSRVLDTNEIYELGKKI